MRGTGTCGKYLRAIHVEGAARAAVATLFVLVTTAGCDFLQAGQGTRPQSSQIPAASTGGAGGGHPSIVLGSASGAPGQDVNVTAVLHTGGNQVAGTQNDLSFDAGTASMGSGKPTCRVNGSLGKAASAFSLRPPGCQGSACSAVRALVLAVDNVDPIPDGSTLYTCTVHISQSAKPGQYPLKVGGVILSTPSGQKVGNAGGSDGVLTVAH